MGLGTVMALGGLGLSAFGAYSGLQESKSQADDMRRQAEQERVNAERQNRQSYDAFHQGEVEARRRSQQLAQLQGSNRVGTAGSGLLVGEGGGTTQADVWKTNADAAATDIDIITGNAKLQQDALDTQAANRRTRANQLDLQAKETERAGQLNALIQLGAAVGSAGLGMWGSSVYGEASTNLANGLLGDKNALLAGIEGMEKSSLINAGGSMLAGLGGGQMGQGVYNTATRWAAAQGRVDAYKKLLESGKQDVVTRTFGLGLQ